MKIENLKILKTKNFENLKILKSYLRILKH